MREGGAVDAVTVYVDEFPWADGKWGGGGHMLGTDLDELHIFAARLGLKRAWFQGHTTFAHYDLTKGKRAKALALGAVPIEMGELPDDVLMRCRDGSYEHRSDRMGRRTDAQRGENRG